MDPSEIIDRIDTAPEFALILGSGLGGLADAVERATIIQSEEIDGYPQSTVAGHSGRLIIGRLEGAPVLVVQGRVHLYEGHDLSAVTYPIRLAHRLGARRLLVTNAAGGIHPNAEPGSLLFITDHINFTGAIMGRLAGKPGSLVDGRLEKGATVESEAAARVRAVSSPYDAAWIDRAEACAIELGIRTTRGVYCWTRGPSYETKAEIAAFRRLGADAVGMSTVPEVLEASSLGMPVLGISTITNRAAGLSKKLLSHDDVLRVGRRASLDLERLVRHVLREEHR